jgi:hypothetical protein
MLKVGVIILVIMLAYATVYSLISVIVPKVMMKGSVSAATGKTLEDAESAGYLKIMTIAHRNLGLFALATTMSGFFVLFGAFKKAQQWSWWCFLVVGCIAWLGNVIIAIVIGDNVNMIMSLIGLVVYLVGLLLPVKAFFGGAPEEA